MTTEDMGEKGGEGAAKIIDGEGGEGCGAGLRAEGDFAVEVDLDVLGGVAGGEEGAQLGKEFAGEFDIVGHAGGFVVEVGMGEQVGAVARGAALEVDRTHEIAMHEGFEAVVNGGEGDGGFGAFDAGKNLVGRRVVALGDKAAIH